jgi:hypothetical protein
MARSTKPSTPIEKAAFAAIEEIAASDMAMEQELADFTGSPSTPQEQSDYQELVTLLQSLDGPEYSLRTKGYSRAAYPGQAVIQPLIK